MGNLTVSIFGQRDIGKAWNSKYYTCPADNPPTINEYYSYGKNAIISYPDNSSYSFLKASMLRSPANTYNIMDAYSERVYWKNALTQIHYLHGNTTNMLFYDSHVSPITFEETAENSNNKEWNGIKDI